MSRSIIAALCLMVAASAFAQGGPELGIETLVASDAIPAGGEGRALVSVTLPEGWHANAHEPLEDFLIKTELTFDDSSDFEVTEVVYPEPEVKKFGFSDEPMAVYEGTFKIGFAIKVMEDASPGPRKLTGTLRYQACDDTACFAPKNVPVAMELKVAETGYTPVEMNTDAFASIPFAMAKEESVSAPITFGGEGAGEYVTGEVVPEFDAVEAGGAMRIALHVDIAEPYHINAHKPLDSSTIATVWSLELPDGATVAEVGYPEAKVKTFSFQTDPLAVYEGKITIGAIIDAGDLAPGEYTIASSLKYQACDDTVCYRPITEAFEIPLVVLEPGEQPTRVAKAEIFDAIAFTGDFTPPDADTNQSSTVAADAGDWEELLPQFTVLAQASGIMSVEEFTAFIDGAESGEGYSQGGFLEGRSIWFVIGAAIIGGLLLNLTPCVLPVIPINLAIIGAGVQGMREGSTRGRGFALGGIYGLGIAIVFGGLGLIVVLGLGSFGAINANWWFSAGIAVLFIVLALAMFDVIMIDFSKFQTKLGIQQSKGSFAFAFIMGAVSALLAGACVAPVLIAVLLYSQDLYANGSPVGLVLPFMLGLGMALPWPFAGAGMSFLPKPGMWMVRVKQAMGVFILGFALYYAWIGYGQFSNIYLVDRDAVIESAEQFDEKGWHTVLGNGLAQAKEEDKLVLIDFWASWCKNCLTMDHTTLVDPAIEARLEDYVKIKYQAETPDDSPHKDVLAYFDQYVGLPHYAILRP